MILYYLIRPISKMEKPIMRMKAILGSF